MGVSNDLWNQCLAVLREQTDKDTFENLIKPLRVESVKDRVVVQSANRWIVKRAQEECGDLIKGVISGATGVPHNRISFSDKRSTKATRLEALRVDNRATRQKIVPDLDQNFRFDNFLTGDSKEVEKAIAMNIADSFNNDQAIVVIFGSSGFGKTHLLHAMGHRIYEKHPDKVLKLAHSTTFVNEVTSRLKQSSSRHRSTHEAMRQLQQEYTHPDVILIDDLHHLMGKKKIQEEFLNLLNLWQQQQTKLAFTTLGDLKQLDGLESALRSRLLGGVAIHAVEPDDTVKVKVLLHQAQKEDINLDPSVAAYLASHLDGDIRVLKGTLLSIARTQAFARKRSSAVTRDVVDDTLSKLNRHKQAPTVDYILAKVSEHFDISISDIRSSTRTRNKLIPRQMGMVLTHELTTLPLTEIASAFGRKDHSTVKNTLVALPEKMKKNPDLKRDYDKLLKALK